MMNKSLEDSINDTLSPLVADGEKIKSVIRKKQQPTEKSFARWRITVVAACLIFALSLTALAAGLGYFDLFFEDKTDIISGDIVQVKKSVENNDIIFAVESAYTSVSGGFITATFTKKDGGIFGREPHDGSPVYFYDFQVYRKVIFDIPSLSEEIDMPVSSEVILSDDNKTLYLLIAVGHPAGKGDLEGRKVNLRVDYIKGPRKGAYYEGPWEIDVTMPKTDTNIRHSEIDMTTKANMSNLPEEAKTVTIETVDITPSGCVLRSVGDSAAVWQVVFDMGYALKDGTQTEQAKSRMVYYEEDGKVVSYILFDKPVSVDEIEYLLINDEEVPLD